MQISCERCATVYVLDDRLIPPSGAPVQCTRCGFVFTAKPAANAPAAKPAPKPTAPPPSAQVTPDRSGTQIFGAPAPRPTAPPPSSPAPSAPTATQMFGAPPAAQPGHATQIFGAPSAPAKAPAGPATQMFGALGAAPAPAASAPHATQMFGAPSPSHDTPMFGAIPAVSAPGPAAGAPMYGAAAGEHANTGRAAVTFFPKREDPAAQAAADLKSAADGPPTQPFGHAIPKISREDVPRQEVEDEEPPPPSRQDRTLIFGKPTGPSQPVAEAGSERFSQMFGTPAMAPARTAAPEAVDSAATTPVETPAVGMDAATLLSGAAYAPAADAAALEAAPAEQPAASAGATAAPIDAPTVVPSAQAEAAPEPAGDAEPAAAVPTPAATPAWMAPAAASAEAVAPRPEPIRRRVSGTAPRAAPLPMDVPSAVGSQTLELQAALMKSRTRTPMIIGAAVLVALIAGATVAWLRSRPPPLDAAAVAEDRKALDLIRRDDEQSLREAIQVLQAVQARAPDFVPARADELVAHVLLTQDLREEIRRQTARAAAAERELKRIEEKKDSPDWLARANAKREEMVAIKGQTDPLIDEATQHDERAGQLLKSCKELVERLGLDGGAVFRASALYYAAKGNENAEKLAEAYRRATDERSVLGDDKRAFADLAVAALHAQARISPEKRDKGLAAVKATLAADPKLLRGHLLSARLHFASRDYEPAKQALTELLVLNPNHVAAKRLQAEISDVEARAVKAAPESETSAP